MLKIYKPQLPVVIGQAKTKIYYRATVCRTCVLVVPRTVKVGLTKVGNQEQTLTYSEEKLYFVPI